MVLILSKVPHQKNNKVLKPLRLGMAEVYGILAVLVVLIPEWLAEVAIAICQINFRNKLRLKRNLWQTIPELRLAAMNIRELRLLAKELNLQGYSNENKNVLSRRVFNALHRESRKCQTHEN